MPRNHHEVKFYFDLSVSIQEAEGTLQLALMAVGSMYGPDRMRLEAQTKLCLAQRTCSIDISTEVGRSLAAIFLGYVRREFGDQAMRVATPVKGAV
jgi:hypothetical protein